MIRPLCKEIFLVRHGETEWSLKGRHTGRTDIPLTERGKKEALNLKQRLASHRFDRVFFSPLARAKETCRLAGLLDHAIADSDLVEWDYGNYEGLTSQEIHQQDPEWTIFSHGAPGGESLLQATERVDRLLARLSPIQGKIILFSSGHLLRLLAARWLSLPPSGGQYFILTTASLSVLSYEHQRYPVISCWNS